MYTQCPECEVAFRVTADVLKQAAGKVRCGGCGVAFNALAHLSEEMPDNAATENPPGEAATPPQSISAEQSAALLKTLDQLAGDDVRIEDTGVEWRVIDVDEDEEIADDPVPGLLHEEMRFDDNTPLPDDFDLDTPAAVWPAPEPEAEPEPEPELDDSQVDLVFGEPDEWEDLLDDLDDAVAEIQVEAYAAADEIEIEAPELEDEELEIPAAGDEIEVVEAKAIEDSQDLRADQPDDVAFAFDIDSQFARQAEALGLDVTGEQEVLEPEETDSETSIEEDLIAAAFETEAAARSNRAADSGQTNDDTDGESVADDEAGEINLENVAPEELSRAGILDEDDYLESFAAEDEAAVLDEIELEASPADRALAEAVFDGDPQPVDSPVDVFAEDAQRTDSPAAVLADEPAAEDISDAAADEDLLDESDLDDEEQLPDEAELAAELGMALDGIDDIDYAEPEEADIPELTEEEKTVNMLIDQDLLAIAVEDDDGFTSTIVQKQSSDATVVPAARSVDAQPAAGIEESGDAGDAESSGDDLEALVYAMPAADDNPLMETIIMEGESVMTEDDQERLEAARAAAEESLKKAGFDEEKTRFSFRDWEPPRHSMAAAAALLFVILVIQVIHQSREALAVSPAFQNTIGPVYRMLGSPVTPAWDITGWRFEATKGSTDDANNVLTIYSRVGNNSTQALPYPLIHVELKDRFEEIVGSKVLEPAEYLVDEAEPGRPVQPKQTFNAVIAIDSPSAEATSFKLNVCYRIGGGQLRCDNKDFR